METKAQHGDSSAADPLTCDPLSAATHVHVLGMDYLHVRFEKGDDLYLTKYAVPLAKHLLPEQWFDQAWFQSHREKLDGSGAVYALPTKPIGSENLALVVKYSRVGERVPIDTNVIEDVLSCEFNGPFEEFALLEELRNSQSEQSSVDLETQLPLAIYVPPERWQPSQLRRFQWRIARKVALHPGIAIDIMREYVMVYSWIPGIDAWEAHKSDLLSLPELHALNKRARTEMEARGFSVLDTKPEHIIVELLGANKLKCDSEGVSYGMVDYELLSRTPEYLQRRKRSRRAEYERRRAITAAGGSAPGASPSRDTGRRLAEIMGVDYVHGRSESTGGMLWVVGRDAQLFDYFLPERWRTTDQVKFVDTHDTFFTTSKDEIRLVWKVSRVGERGEVAAFGADGFRLLAFGFNSPFEEVSLARRLRRHGLPTIEPVAIYRTGSRSKLSESIFDGNRFKTHAQLLACDGEPLLVPHHNYVTVWEHWNGPQTEPPPPDAEEVVLRSLDLARARSRGLLDAGEAGAVLGRVRERLTDIGVEVIRLDPTHVLVALAADDTILRDDTGLPEICLCNFQFLSWPSEGGRSEGP
jgi:hypothetical protein